ncbi:MAG: TonB-system energizer ExbB [Gammaproteobacteria bacterium]|nr:MAG: TonB-system energizer ExbB [Gammaproteobacteria bacterium]
MELIKQYLDLGIFGLLGLMSFLALAWAIERWLRYRSIRLERYRQLEQLKLDLGRRLPIIATIGANAPYVGLLGTVFGIMITFYDIGQGGQIDTGAIMVGLALALKATAAGLLVAIPSLVFYNGLAHKAETLISEWKILNRLKAKGSKLQGYEQKKSTPAPSL